MDENINNIATQPPQNEHLILIGYYGGRKVLDLDTMNLTPLEVSNLVQTICQLTVGIGELRKHETDIPGGQGLGDQL